MTTWKNSGDTSANSCRKNDATNTSPRRCRYLWIAPMNQVMSKRRVISDNPARRVIRISPPSQTARSSPRVIKAGRDASGDWTKTLSSPALATTRKPPSRRAAMAGKGVLASRDQSVRQARALSPRFLGAPEHLRCANLGCSQPMPDLFAISRNTLQMQQCHERLRAPDRLVSRCLFQCSLAFSGARCRLKRAAASATAAGFPVDWQSALHRDHRPPRRSSMPCAGQAGRDPRRASHRLPSRCRRCCCCSPRPTVTVWPSATVTVGH